ncbi:MAG TPA: hypothetical protein VMW36_00285 [Patescibacteria group bacterium]|nr:hypothetical protein [Patescibacteria group bacterium]
MSSEKLTEIERKTYEFIKSAGDIHPRDMPNRNMIGAISTLKHRGLVEIYRDYTSSHQKKKKKFVRIKRELPQEGEETESLDDASAEQTPTMEDEN